MRLTGWSWTAFSETPEHVRKIRWDWEQARIEAENKAANKSGG
jgi:hypothetical protein